MVTYAYQHFGYALLLHCIITNHMEKVSLLLHGLRVTTAFDNMHLLIIIRESEVSNPNCYVEQSKEYTKNVTVTSKVNISLFGTRVENKHLPLTD